MNTNTQFNLAHFLPFRINRIAEKIGNEFLGAHVEPEGLSRANWRTLIIIGQDTDITASDVVKLTGMHKTKVSRSVSLLQERGLIERVIDNHDRRIERLSLTSAGLALFERLSSAAISYEEAFLDSLEANISRASLLNAIKVLEARLSD